MTRTKISLLVIMIALFILSGQSAFATRDTYIDGDFVYNTKTKEIVAYYGTSSDVIIPENSVVGKDFKFTSHGLLSETGEYVKIKKFVVSKGVAVNGTLGLSAYNGFTDVEFYNTADEMPDVDYFFAGDEKLKKLILPEGLTEIRSGMCGSCEALTEIYIPDSVNVIGQTAFQRCKNINVLSLPASLEEIGEKAFDGCNGIRKVYVPVNANYRGLYVPYELENAEFERKPENTADFYRTFLHTKWFENDVLPTLKSDFLQADGSVFRYIGNDKNVTVPDGTEIIEAEAFKQCDIESVTLPETLKEIKTSAFAGCSKLKEVIIPKSVKMVEFAAFSECSALEKIIIDGSPVMDDNVFEFCYSLTDEGIIINGEIQYIVSVTGEKSIPFAFTNTSYNDGIFSIGEPEPSNTTNADITPASTSEPSEAVTPEVSAKPQSTDKATAIPQTKTLEVNGNDMSIRVDDNAIDFPDAKPFIDNNDRTQIPIRAVAELMDCTVEWNDEAKTAIITNKNGDVVKITIDSKTLTKNGEKIEMDTAAIIKDERTYIPVRFVAEAMGLTVEWKN